MAAKVNLSRAERAFVEAWFDCNGDWDKIKEKLGEDAVRTHTWNRRVLYAVVQRYIKRETVWKDIVSLAKVKAVETLIDPATSKKDIASLVKTIWETAGKYKLVDMRDPQKREDEMFQAAVDRLVDADEGGEPVEAETVAPGSEREQ